MSDSTREDLWIIAKMFAAVGGIVVLILALHKFACPLGGPSTGG